jgi:hypothetical protein
MGKLTRKEFQAVADILAESKDTKQVQNKLETYFKQENPEFDVDRFREAIHRKKVRRVV